MTLRVGVSSGIYYAARAEELATVIKKLGYTLTRGVGCMEIAADTAHEITFTAGLEIRHMAKKQGVTTLFHGDLQVPMCIPERVEWREAHDKITKSIRSAVYAGAKYVNFHACLREWLELVTTAGRKLTLTFVDHAGRFIAKVLTESKDLREWFVKKKAEDYYHDVLDLVERQRFSHKADTEVNRWIAERTDKELRSKLKGLVPADNIDFIINAVLTRRVPPDLPANIRRVIDGVQEGVARESGKISGEFFLRAMEDAVREKLKSGKPWYKEDFRGTMGVVDGYHIMAHYLFYKKDPQWVAMTERYPKLMQKYSLDYADPKWLDNAWKKAEEENDRLFKEFFYAAVGAKYLEGHMDAALKWMKDTFIPDEIMKIKDKKEREELLNVAKTIIIAIENPDARQNEYAGLYFLYRPMQIYSAVKTLRSTLNTNRVMILVDHEHVATQGLDALIESNSTIKTIPDFGKLTIAVHSNHPHALHSHEPLSFGDIVLYELLYNLRVTGLGKDRTAYLIFERGGGEDPFKQSVDVLKIMGFYLEKDVAPKDLPLEFYGMKGPTAGDITRQGQIIRDHAWEPLKDLLEIPDEEWTFLSQAAIKKGKKPEVWKKAEFR